MSKKEGGKNRKFGRHARNPSSAMQAKRTERNKAKRIALMHERKQKLTVAGGKPHPRVIVEPLTHVIFSGIVRNQAGGPLHCLFVEHTLVQIGTLHDVVSAKRDVHATLGYTHEILNPGGSRQLVERRLST